MQHDPAQHHITLPQEVENLVAVVQDAALGERPVSTQLLRLLQQLGELGIHSCGLVSDVGDLQIIINRLFF